MTQDTSHSTFSPADGLADLVHQIRAYGGASISGIRSAMRAFAGVSEESQMDSAASLSTAIFRACEQESLDEAKLVVRLLIGSPRLMIADIEGSPSMTRFLAEIEGPELGSGPWGTSRGESEAAALVCAALQARLRMSFPDHPLAVCDLGLLPLWMVSRADEPWPCRGGMTVAAGSALEAIAIFSADQGVDADFFAALCIGVSDEADPCVVHRIS